MRRRRGIALVLALLLVAIGTISIAALIDTSQLALARTRNLLREQQAYAYARGLEAWAIELLRRDQNEDPNRDSRQDLWARGLPPMEIPGGRLDGRMRDLNGCFNLNSLLRQGQEDAIGRRRFDRLLVALQLDPGLSESVLDWIDSDNAPRARGAESLSYLLLDPPYRAANRPLLQVNELRLVRGIDASVYQRLEPHVCALPTPSAINVNTASIPVLMALADHADHEGVVFAGQELLAWKTGYSERQVRRILDSLEEKRILIPQNIGRGRGVVQGYRIETQGAPRKVAEVARISVGLKPTGNGNKAEDVVE